MKLDAATGKQVGKNVLSGWLFRVVKLVIALVTSPLLIARFGKEGYGLLILLTTLIGFSELTDLGLRPALGRELAQARAEGNTTLFNRLCSTALLLYAGLFFILATAALLTTDLILENVGATQKEQARVLFYSYGVLGLGIAFARPVFSAVLAATNRFDIRNRIDTYNTLTAGIGIIAVLTFTKFGIMVWAAINGLALIQSMVLLVRASYREQPSLSLSYKLASLKLLPGLYKLGGQLTLSQWARKLKFDADPFLINAFLTPAALVIYKPGNSLMANLRPLLSTFAGQLYPLTTALAAQKEDEQLSRVFFAASRYTLLMAVFPLVVAVVYANPLMTLWLGKVLAPADVAQAAYILIFWAGIEACVALEGTSWSILFAKRKIGFVAVADFVAAAINISASFLLLKYFPALGVSAVMWPSLILEGILRPLIALRAARTVGGTFLEIFRQCWSAPLGVALLLTLFACLFQYFFGQLGLINLAAQLLSLTLIYAFLSWKIALLPAERSRLQNMAIPLLTKIFNRLR
jgi:O-antigen/teichoic acid export membrane protein